jgi:hypothetical protein
VIAAVVTSERDADMPHHRKQRQAQQDVQHDGDNRDPNACVSHRRNTPATRPRNANPISRSQKHPTTTLPSDIVVRHRAMQKDRAINGATTHTAPPQRDSNSRHVRTQSIVAECRGVTVAWRRDRLGRTVAMVTAITPIGSSSTDPSSRATNAARQ